MTTDSRRWLGRARHLFLLGALTLLLSACGEHGPQSFWGRPESDFARILQDLFSQIVFLAAIVFVVVEAVLFYAVFKYRRRSTDLPSQTHGNSTIEIMWTIAPAVVLVFVALPTVRAIFQSYHPQKEGTVQVKAIGHQWWWEFQYPQLGITTANEIHFPAGQRATIEIESADIIHGFWVPNLGGKRDAIPTRINELWWTPDRAGLYFGQCTQLCGTSHANMRLRAIVHEPAEWDAWLATMRAGNPPPTAGSPEVQRGHQLVSTGACIGCHTIQGVPSAQGKVGPNLTNYGSRTTLGSGMYPNTKEALVRWLKNPQEAKPGNKMPNLALSDEDASAIADYLLSLR
jgi:cytochrome c oxidase subunit 2